MSIARNYDPLKIGRPNTLVGNDNIRSPSGTAFRLVEKRIVPALKSTGKYAVRGIAKAGTSTFKTLGQGLGLTAGTGLAVATGQPELAPFLATAGGIAGGELGKYYQKKADKAIDKFR